MPLEEPSDLLLPDPPRKALWLTLKLAGAVLLLVVGVAVAYCYSDRLSFDALARHEAQLRRSQAERPWLVYGAAFLLYVGVTGLSVPGATPLSVTFGWLFGFWPALLLVSFASTCGATISFLLSRYLLRDWVQGRFGGKLKTTNAALASHGAVYLLALRLNPVVPYFAINLFMGLSNLPLRTYWWVSQLGMLPVTSVVVNAGASLPSLAEIGEEGLPALFTPRLLVALILLSSFPILIKFGIRHWMKVRI